MSTHTLEPKITVGITPAVPPAPAEAVKARTSTLAASLRTAVLITLATTVIFGLLYPLAVTAVSQLLFPHQANGSLIKKNNQIVGSELIGQSFTGPGYFHSRPSAAGAGYDASQSSGSNFAPTNHQLIDRVKSDAAKLHAENPNMPIPIDLLTASGSGLDPEISPAAAEFQIPRIARERGIPESQVRQLIAKHTLARQFGFLGEPRVRVLELNLDLEAAHPLPKQ
ncbi:MAG TPA: potassium-transporting ATPase subunit KdpC [Candidatus Sulfotelmatobacter sp.]|nr:potassium-transporting ATPase subunit KdpC [Candidatus Sulfotelmatobacter sp.]